MSKQPNRFKDRPLSYSQLSSFEYDPAEWYRCYILGEKDPPNDQMKLGTLVGDSIGKLESLVPGLEPAGVKEYEMRASLGNIHMVGYADHYCVEKLILNENKTSDKRTKWTQESVDNHGQLTMYALLLLLQNKTKPEDVTMFLNYIPTIRKGVKFRLVEPVEVYTFETSRTTMQVLDYANYIKRMVNLMDEYVTRSK